VGIVQLLVLFLSDSDCFLGDPWLGVEDDIEALNELKLRPLEFCTRRLHLPFLQRASENIFHGGSD